jgi:hypothetical protein
LGCYEETFDSDASAAMVTSEYPFKGSASLIAIAEFMASCGSWLLSGDLTGDQHQLRKLFRIIKR